LNDWGLINPKFDDDGCDLLDLASPLIELLSRTSSYADVEKSKYFKILESLEKHGGERVQDKVVKDAMAIAST
jgi:hypothetical protein